MEESPRSGPGSWLTPGESWTVRRGWLAALAVAVAVSFTGVFDHALWIEDEPRDAEVGREMLVSGKYWVPTDCGEPFLQKPPLGWWPMVALYRLFGVSDGVARSSSALAAVVTLLLLYDAVRRVADPFAGVMAVIAASTTSVFYHYFHMVLVDPWLAATVMLGYWGFVVAAFPGPGAGAAAWRRRASGILVVHLAAGLSFLAKGPLGPVLIAGPLLAAVAIAGRWDLFRSRAHLVGLSLALALCAAWLVLIYRAGGRANLDQFLTENIVNRVRYRGAGVHMTEHKRALWYYLVVMPPGLVPWLAAIPAACVFLGGKRWPAGWNRAGVLALASIFPVGFVLLSLPGTKRDLYQLPLLAPFGAAIGVWLAASARQERPGGLDRWTQLVLIAGMAGAAAYAAGAAIAATFGSHTLDRYVFDMKGLWSSPTALGLSGITLGAVAAFAVCGARAWRKRSAQTGPLAAWMALALVTLGGTVGFRVADRFNNLHRMTGELAGLGAFAPSLAEFRLHDMMRGIVPFDTGVMPKHITSPEELAQHVREAGAGNVLTQGSAFRRLPPDLLAQFRLVRTWWFIGNESYHLYRFGPEAGGPPAK